MKKYKSQTVIKAQPINGGISLYIRSPELHAIWTRGYYLELLDKDKNLKIFRQYHAYADVLDEVREAILTKAVFEANYINNNYFYNDIFHNLCQLPELISSRMDNYWLFNRDNFKYNYVPLILTKGLDEGVTYTYEGLYSSEIVNHLIELYKKAISTLIAKMLVVK